MSTVVETSFFLLKNAGLFNSKLRQVADANRKWVGVQNWKHPNWNSPKLPKS